MLSGMELIGAEAANDTTTQSYLYPSKYTSAVNKYTDYKAVKYDTLQFAIPGIGNGTTGGVKVSTGFFADYIPQGITYNNHTKKIYMSAYSESKQNTVVFVLSATGKYERTLEIENYTGHAGGVASDNRYLYLVSGLSIYYIGLDSIATALEQASNTVTIQKSRIAVNSALCAMNVGDYADSSNVFSSCSFCTYFNGLFWFGEFSLDTQQSDYPYRASGESYFFGVDLSDLSTPVLKKVMTVPCKTQGASFFKDSSGNTYLACSMSYGRNNASTMRFYKINQSEWGSDAGYGQGTQASTGVTKFVHKNTNIKQLSMPNMMEDICTAVSSNKLYLLSVYESGAKKYYDSASYVMDRVSAVDIGSTLNITASAQLPAVEHTYIQSAITQPDCTHAGSATYTCSICGAKNAQSLPKPGHDFTLKIESDDTLVPDFADEPEYYYTCSRCETIDTESGATFSHTTNTLFGAVDMSRQAKAVTVTLLQEDRVIAQKSLEKDSNGVFVFRGVPHGEYSMRLSGHGLLSLSLEGIVFESDSALRVASAAINSEPLCAGDINADNVVDLADLSIMLRLEVFGQFAMGADEDINGDGTVNIEDIGIVLLADNFAQSAKTIQYSMQ